MRKKQPLNQLLHLHRCSGSGGRVLVTGPSGKSVESKECARGVLSEKQPLNQLMHLADHARPFFVARAHSVAFQAFARQPLTFCYFLVKQKVSSNKRPDDKCAKNNRQINYSYLALAFRF